MTTISIFQWICVAIIQPSNFQKVRTVNYILASSHHDRMRGAMLFCPGVIFCNSKQSLKLYESPIDEQHIHEQNLKRILRQSLVDVGLSITRPSDLFLMTVYTVNYIVTILLMLMTWRRSERSHHLQYSTILHTALQRLKQKINTKQSESSNPLSRLIGGTQDNRAKVAKMFLVSFSTYPEHSVHRNPFTPLSIMLLTGPTFPVADRFATKLISRPIRLVGKTSLKESLPVRKWCGIFFIILWLFVVADV